MLSLGESHKLHVLLQSINIHAEILVVLLNFILVYYNAIFNGYMFWIFYSVFCLSVAASATV